MAAKEFRSLDALMGSTLSALAREGGEGALAPAWVKIAGAGLARHVRVAGLAHGTLALKAATERWRREALALEPQILERLAALLGPGVVVRLTIRVEA